MDTERGVASCVVELDIKGIGERGVWLGQFCVDMTEGKGICLFLVVKGGVFDIWCFF